MPVGLSSLDKPDERHRSTRLSIPPRGIDTFIPMATTRGTVAAVASRRRAFVLRHTRLQPVPDLDSIVLHLADEVLPLWHAIQVETDDPDAALPYWAFAWGGGLAIAYYLHEHPDVVAGRRVFDLASGSGLCAIAAMHAGAASVTAADIDRFALAAIGL